MRRLLAGGAAAMFACAVSAAAAQEIDAARVASACNQDYARFCDGVPIRDGQALRCLADRHDLVSEPCYRNLKIAAAIRACMPDYRRFCGDVPPGGGRVVACLNGNSDRLLLSCRRTLEATAPYGWRTKPEVYLSDADESPPFDDGDPGGAPAN